MDRIEIYRGAAIFIKCSPLMRRRVTIYSFGGERIRIVIEAGICSASVVVDDDNLRHRF
jgi:hypothetical protein